MNIYPVQPSPYNGQNCNGRATSQLIEAAIKLISLTIVYQVYILVKYYTLTFIQLQVQLGEAFTPRNSWPSSSLEKVWLNSSGDLLIPRDEANIYQCFFKEW